MILPNMIRVSQAPERRLYLTERVQLLLLIGFYRQALLENVIVFTPVAPLSCPSHHSEIQSSVDLFSRKSADCWPFSLHFIWSWRWSWVMWGSYFGHCHDFSPGDGQKQSHDKSMGVWGGQACGGKLENRLLTMIYIIYIFLIYSVSFVCYCFHGECYINMPNISQYGVPNLY